MKTEDGKFKQANVETYAWTTHDEKQFILNIVGECDEKKYHFKRKRKLMIYEKIERLANYVRATPYRIPIAGVNYHECIKLAENLIVKLKDTQKGAK